MRHPFVIGNPVERDVGKRVGTVLTFPRNTCVVLRSVAGFAFGQFPPRHG